jgi:arylsulfatase A-like enzyme
MADISERRRFLKLLGLGGASLALPGCGALAPRAGKEIDGRPNIIFILADDLGYGDLGCYGQEKIKTPHLDAMAAGGMRFTRHYAGSTVCAPSRCSLMTGLHTGHAFIRGNKAVKPEGQFPIPESTFTVADLLRRAGYATGCVGKWGLGGPGSPGEPNLQGFDHYFGYLCQREAHFFHPRHLWRNGEKVALDGKTYSHDLLTANALEFIRRNRDRPFFLYLPYTIPHAELSVPDDSMEPYRGLFEEKPFAGGHYGAQPEPRAALAGMISRLDADVGRILTLLEELDIDERTLVLFSSDNGPHAEGGATPEFFDSSGGLRGIKRDLYEGGIRVPLIARWPGQIRAGAVSDHVSAFWDFLPTCADLAGAGIPADCDGISFMPELLGRRQMKHDHLYWEFHERGGRQAVLTGRWKGVRHDVKKDAASPIELYDLENDPAEERNVAALHPEIVERIGVLMKTEHRESVHFPFLPSAKEDPSP